MTIPQPSPTPPAAAVPPDAWLRAKELFAAVVALPPDERAPLLDAGCGDDAALRQFVEALLRSNDALSTERSKTADLGLGPLVRRAIQQRWPQVERGRRFGAFAVVEEIATTLDAARADGEADEQRVSSRRRRRRRNSSWDSRPAWRPTSMRSACCCANCAQDSGRSRARMTARNCAAARCTMRRACPVMSRRL